MSPFAHKNMWNVMQKTCVMKTKFVHLTWRKSNISHTNVKSLVNIIRAKSLLYRLLLSNLKKQAMQWYINYYGGQHWCMKNSGNFKYISIIANPVCIFQYFRVVSVSWYKMVSVDWNHIANSKQCLQKYTNKKVWLYSLYWFLIFFTLVC